MTIRPRRVSPVLLSLVVSLFLLQPLQAIDQVLRKSSKTPIRGKITAVAKTGVTVKPQVGQDVTVPANDIKDVRWNGEPVKLITARISDHAGRYDRALVIYAEAQADPKASAANIKLDLQFLIARATARQALAGVGKLEDAQVKLKAFVEAGSDSFRYFDAVNLLGQVQLTAGDYDAAKAQFAGLSGAPWSDYQLAGQSAQARVLLAQDDVDGALAAFQIVITKSQKSQLPAEIDQRYQAVLGKSACLIRKKDKASFEAALKELAGVLSGAADENARVLAEGYLRQGDCLRLLGRHKEAVLAYLHVDLLFAGEQALHAEALYRLGPLWSAVGQPERAVRARARLRSDYPQSPWTKKLGG